MTNDQSASPGSQLELKVGRAIRTWVTVEHSLSLFLSMLLGVDQFRARIIIASMPNFRARRELIIRLAETYLDRSQLPDFRKLMRRLKKLGAKRNALAHRDIAATLESNGKHLMFNDTFPEEMDGGLGFKSEYISLKEIDDLSSALQKLFSDMLLFCEPMSKNIHTSARIHREQQNDPSP